MLKEAALRTGCLTAAANVGTRAGLDPAVLAERLLLCVYRHQHRHQGRVGRRPRPHRG